jgi:hypothetical protein
VKANKWWFGCCLGAQNAQHATTPFDVDAYGHKIFLQKENIDYYFSRNRKHTRAEAAQKQQRFPRKTNN